MTSLGVSAGFVTKKRPRSGLTWCLGTLIMGGRIGIGLRGDTLIMAIVILLRKQAKAAKSTLCVHRNVKYCETRGHTLR